MSKPIRILIADDHAMVRDGLATIIGFEKDFEVVGEAVDGTSAVKKAKSLSPDLVLMDLMMPGMGGTEATAEILKARPETKVLVLTSFGSAGELTEVFGNGAAGAITKTMSGEALVKAIRDVMSGKWVVAPEIETALKDSALIGLSPRQKQMVDSLTRGLTNKDISRQFGISLATVKLHLSEVFRKLNVANRSEAVSVALKRRLLDG